MSGLKISRPNVYSPDISSTDDSSLVYSSPDESSLETVVQMAEFQTIVFCTTAVQTSVTQHQSLEYLRSIQKSKEHQKPEWLSDIQQSSLNNSPKTFYAVVLVFLPFHAQEDAF